MTDDELKALEERWSYMQGQLSMKEYADVDALVVEVKRLRPIEAAMLEFQTVVALIVTERKSEMSPLVYDGLLKLMKPVLGERTLKMMCKNEARVKELEAQLFDAQSVEFGGIFGAFGLLAHEIAGISDNANTPDQFAAIRKKFESMKAENAALREVVEDVRKVELRLCGSMPNTIARGAWEMLDAALSKLDGKETTR